jgi:hypothetical protein
MAARKPKIVYYWVFTYPRDESGKIIEKPPVVNWRLVSANGETMCQSTQGFRDKTDARRSVLAVCDVLAGDNYNYALDCGEVREVGPGRKPS